MEYSKEFLNWRFEREEKYKEYQKQWYDNDKENMLKRKRNRKQKQKDYIREYYNRRRKTDLKFNLKGKMGTAICYSLKGNKKGRHWENLVGYKLKDLIKHLKKTMPEGYNWRDYLEGKLHIDHIIPISAFNYEKPEHTDFKRCWSLNNLRLLTVRENLIKHNKLTKPFQPSLKI